jgi:hypothetical protein
VPVEGKSPTTLQGCDKILETLAERGQHYCWRVRAPLLASTLKTTALYGSCNQVSHSTSQLIQAICNMAYQPNEL